MRPDGRRTDQRPRPTGRRTGCALPAAARADLQEAVYGIPRARRGDSRCKFLRRRRVISLSVAFATIDWRTNCPLLRTHMVAKSPTALLDMHHLTKAYLRWNQLPALFLCQPYPVRLLIL